jgi:hypothetical protein
MDTAKPGTQTDPASVVPNAWSLSIPKIQEVYINYGLDQPLMNGKSFFRNFTGHPTCPDLNMWGKVLELETNNIPSLKNAFFEDAKLNIFVQQPFTDGRADGAVYLNSDINLGNYIECYYPKSSYITKQVQGCQDIWWFNIPWSIARKCGWNQTQDETHQIYKGQVIIHNLEYLGIDQWRIVRSVLRIKLRFQRFARVETDSPAQVFNDRITKAAITAQIVATTLGDPAVIELTTVLQWPYKLYNGSMSVSPAGKVESHKFNFDDCVSAQNTSCRQSWRTTLTLTENTCTLDGSYRLNWTMGCGEDVQKVNCPLSQPTDLIGAVDYKLKSENFCSEVSVDVSLVGNLKSYQNDSFSATSVSFIVGRSASFLVRVNSELNPKNSSGVVSPDDYNPALAGTVIKFSSTKLISVYVRTTTQTTPLKIFKDGKAAVFDAENDPGTNCVEITKKMDGTTLIGNQVGFNITLSKKLAATLVKNGKLDFIVSAEVQVTYSDTKKRFTLATNVKENDNYPTQFELQDDPNAPTDTPTPGPSTTAVPGPTTTAVPGPTTTAAPSTKAPTNKPADGGNGVTLICSFVFLIFALLFK